MPALIHLLRPHQWLKNGFVFVGLLFGHAWHDPLIIGQALAAVCLFGGSVLAVFYAGSAPWIFFAYVAMNIAYSLGLKHIVILDVFIIASGFMLRILAGTLGLGIAPSHWLLLCGLMLTLFLGFAKRLAELNVLHKERAGHRRVLEYYTAPMLDQFIGITAAATVISYALYTVSAETAALHGTQQLILTVPFVLYGMLRYLWRLHAQGGGGDAAQELLTDPHLMAAVFGWLLLVLVLLR